MDYLFSGNKTAVYNTDNLCFWSFLKLPLRKYPNSSLTTVCICMMTSTLILRAYFEIIATVHTFVRKIISKAHLESAGYTHCSYKVWVIYKNHWFLFFSSKRPLLMNHFPSRDTWWLFYFINTIVALGLHQKYLGTEQLRVLLACVFITWIFNSHPRV